MNEYVSLVVNNLMENVFAGLALVVTAVVVPWFKGTAIPWLKEKRLYSLVAMFVRAAEKKAEAGTLAKPLKKDYVVELLEERGYTVTPEVDAFIEAAVKELDNAAQFTIGELCAVMDETEEKTEGLTE